MAQGPWDIRLQTNLPLPCPSSGTLGLIISLDFYFHMLRRYCVIRKKWCIKKYGKLESTSLWGAVRIHSNRQALSIDRSREGPALHTLKDAGLAIPQESGSLTLPSCSTLHLDLCLQRGAITVWGRYRVESRCLRDVCFPLHIVREAKRCSREHHA